MEKIIKYLNNVKGIKAFSIGFIIPMIGYSIALFIRFLFDYNTKFNPDYFMTTFFTVMASSSSFIQYRSLRVGLVLSFISTIIISVALKVVYNIGSF